MRNKEDYFERFKKGEEIALDHYFKRHIQPLSFFAFKLTKDQQVSEEIVCDTFLKLWQVRERIDTDMHLHSFLFKVTRNACLNHLQKKKSLPIFEEDYNAVTQLDDRDIHFDMIYSEFIKILYKELDKLPDQQAKVFKMSYLEGCTTEEICQALDTTANTVFYAKSKALQALRKTFKKQDLFMYSMFAWLFLK